MGRASTCQGRRSTPAWGWSGSRRILQGVHGVFDIDLFRTLIDASVEVTGVRAEGKEVASHRVIADHLRSSSFLIADGVLPSNEGRGYVLRRIMRRAMRHAHLLGAEEPVLYRLVPTLVAEMGRAYPELVRAEALIRETLLLEETRFRRTLARGLTLLDEASGSLDTGDTLAGDVAFRLYDTYGFPLDLTEDALKARGIKVDTARLHPRHGAAEGGGARELGRVRRGADRSDLVQASRAAGRDRVPRLRRRGRRGRGAGDGPRHR